MDFKRGEDRLIDIEEFNKKELKKNDRLMSQQEWMKSKAEPTVRDLWDTINIDMASGVRFYSQKTMKEISNPVDVMNHFLFGFIYGDLYIRFKSGCDHVDNMELTDYLKFIEENYKASIEDSKIKTIQ